MIAALGGFQRRHDRITTVDPGAKVDTGPFTITFTKATVQWSTRYDPKGGDVVRATGTVQNTWTESHQPRANQFAAQDLGGKQSVEASVVQLRGEDSSNGSSAVTPGLPPVPITVVFRFNGKMKFRDAKARIAARKLSYEQHYFLQSSSDKTWSTSDEGFNVELPLKRLPANKK